MSIAGLDGHEMSALRVINPISIGVTTSGLVFPKGQGLVPTFGNGRKATRAGLLPFVCRKSKDGQDRQASTLPCIPLRCIQGLTTAAPGQNVFPPTTTHAASRPRLLEWSYLSSIAVSSHNPPRRWHLLQHEQYDAPLFFLVCCPPNEPC